MFFGEILLLALAVPAPAYAPWSMSHGWRPAVRYAGVSIDASMGVSRSVVLKAESSTEGESEKAEAAPAEEAASEEVASEEAPKETPAAEEDDITSSPVFLKKKIEVLEKEMVELDKNIAEKRALQEAAWAEWGPQIEKMRTEFEVIKRRTAEQRETAEASEIAQILSSIFPATDNFDRAKNYVQPKTESEAKVAAKYAAIGDTLNDAYASLGVVAIDELGAPFDPLVHSAAMYQPSPDYGLDTISEIFEKGYKVGSFLVRPATVVVSSGPPP